jgi:hypothetical protein
VNGQAELLKYGIPRAKAVLLQDAGSAKESRFAGTPWQAEVMSALDQTPAPTEIQQRMAIGERHDPR